MFKYLQWSICDHVAHIIHVSNKRCQVGIGKIARYVRISQFLVQVDIVHTIDRFDDILCVWWKFDFPRVGPSRWRVNSVL